MLIKGCALITTYRCNSACLMCNRHQWQSEAEEEFKPEMVKKLPLLHFINITGGEPFLREDIGEIIKLACKRAQRAVVSTNGTLKEQILKAMSDVPRRVGVRVSLEGNQKINDFVRGVPGGYDIAISTLKELQKMGFKDVGISMTIGDWNYQDVLDMYHLCKENHWQFATGTVHSSFFFASEEEKIELKHKKEICEVLTQLSKEMYADWGLKLKYRALFNQLLAEHIQGIPFPVQCTCGKDFFAINPFGEVYACLGSIEPKVMGNLNTSTFKEVWNSQKAKIARSQCASCTKNCCMSGNRSIDMKNHIFACTQAVIKHNRGIKPLST